MGKSNICTLSGRDPDEVRAEQTQETGQYNDYVILCDEDRAKGFVRPYRDSYKHTVCGGITTMGRKLSETYAVNPSFYSGTFCTRCNKHFPVGEFVWTVDGKIVGS
jgi:hypothetical protein